MFIAKTVTILLNNNVNIYVQSCEFFYEDENILDADAVLIYLHKEYILSSNNPFG